MRTLMEGHSGEDVAGLQQALRDRHNATVPVNGVFDAHTRDAVMSFQRKLELKITGRADRDTLRLLDIPQ